MLWHETRGRIHLIDHGFAFGVAGAEAGELELSAWRWTHADRALSDDELRAVSSLLDANGFGTDEYLEAARAEALIRRAATMRQDRSILEVGVL